MNNSYTTLTANRIVVPIIPFPYHLLYQVLFCRAYNNGILGYIIQSTRAPNSAKYFPIVFLLYSECFLGEASLSQGEATTDASDRLEAYQSINADSFDKNVGELFSVGSIPTFLRVRVS